jgi:hypothetical protein
MADEWGPWIEHDGWGCPCRGLFVHIVIGPSEIADPDDPNAGEWLPGWTPLNSREAVGIAEPTGSWFWLPLYFPIIRYRIRRPRAVRELIDLAESLPEREAVPA